MALAAYFDVSGKPNEGARPYAVAGFGSSVDKWEEFSDAWRKILAAFGLRELHMADMISRRHRRDLRHLTDDDYAAIIKSLFVLVECHVCKSIVRVIEGADLAGVRESGAEPLVVAGGSAIQAAYDWSIKRDRRDVLEAVVFDDGEKGKGALQNTTPAHLPKPEFCNSKLELPIQAADWLAWEVARLDRLHIEHRGDGGMKAVSVRGEVHAAIRHLPRDWKYYHKGSWVDIVDPHARRGWGRRLRELRRHSPTLAHLVP